MLVNKYIESLKDSGDKNKYRYIKKQYQRQLDYLISLPINSKKLYTYIIVISVLLISICLFAFNTETSVIIKLIYSLPGIVFSIISFILYNKVYKSDFKDKKLFQKYRIFELLAINTMFLDGSYFFQTIIYTDLGNKEYTKLLGLLSIFEIITVYISLKNCPKKFLREFAGDKIKYNREGRIGWIIFGIIIIVNATKPYRILLIGCYYMILLMTYYIVYDIYKLSKYDLMFK